MFALAVRFDLKPGAASGFDSLVADLLPLVRLHEPGTLLYVCTKGLDEPDSVRLFFEVYRDREAFEDHERQGHVRRFLESRDEFMAAVRVEFVEPFDAKGLVALSS